MTTSRRGRRAEKRGEHKNTEARPDRVPMSGQRLRMAIPEEAKDPNYRYYWFNDLNDDLYRAELAGYNFVQKKDLKVGERSVHSADSTDSRVSMRVGQGVTAYLMRIPKEYHEEDAAALAAEVDKKESSMKQQLNSGQNGTYGEVKID